MQVGGSFVLWVICRLLVGTHEAFHPGNILQTVVRTSSFQPVGAGKPGFLDLRDFYQ